MAVYLFGTESDVISCSSTTTNATYYDAAFSRSACLAHQTAPAVVEIPTEVGGDDANGWWAGVRYYSQNGYNSAVDSSFFKVRDSAGNVAAQLNSHIGGGYDYNILTVYNAAGGTATFNTSAYSWSGALYAIIFHCYTAGGYSVCKMYHSGVLQASIRVAGANRGIKTLEISSVLSGTTCAMSEVVIADEPIFGLRVKTIPPTADGANTDWSGSYADIDEVAPDSVSVLSTAADEVSTYTHSITLGSDTPYAAIGVGMLAAAGAGAGLQGVLRIGSTDYPSATVDPTLGYTPQFVQWTENPAGGGWHGDAINALEFGVKSVAL